MTDPKPDPRDADLIVIGHRLRNRQRRAVASVTPIKVKGHPRDCGCYFCKRLG